MFDFEALTRIWTQDSVVDWVGGVTLLDSTVDWAEMLMLWVFVEMLMERRVVGVYNYHLALSLLLTDNIHYCLI